MVAESYVARPGPCSALCRQAEPDSEDQLPAVGPHYDADHQRRDDDQRHCPRLDREATPATGAA
jgi:hypothetical protein